MNISKLHIAVDIGASGGIHVVGPFKNEATEYIEVFRFSNNMKQTNDGLIWDIEYIFKQVLKGIEIACNKYTNIVSVGIDTWGVDYVLLENDKIIPPVFAYRNTRTKQSLNLVANQMKPYDHYSLTGTQFQPFNTIYQLYTDKITGRLETATDFLMIPEYFFYLLTGEKVHEYTNATTTGIFNAYLHRYDTNIIKQLDLPAKLFKQPLMPGFATSIKEEYRTLFGQQLFCVLVATHDTASAVESIDIPNDAVFLSSGTWSLMGVKTDTPIISDEARQNNFTNEGGNGYIRFQKNIMGLWIIQELKREFDLDSFEEIIRLAKSSSYQNTFDVNNPRFMSPKSMSHEIKMCLYSRHKDPPTTRGDVINSTLYSLAQSYKETIEEIEAITEKTYDRLIIFGGGAKNDYLNDIIKEFIDKIVEIHPIEASAIGNIKIQKEVLK